MLAICTLLVALSFNQPPPADQAGRIAGRVTVEGTGTPVAEARVILVPTQRPANPAAMPPQPTTYTAARHRVNRAATGASRFVPPENPGALDYAAYFARGFAYHPTGRLLATVALDSAVTLWDVVSGTKQQELTGNAGTLRSVAFSPDGHTCAAGGDNGRVVVWEVSG